MCFRCDGKWEANHVCKRKELSVLIMEGGSTDSGEEENPLEENEADNEELTIQWSD